MQLTVIVLRLIHVLAGVFWVGAALVLTQFVFPSVMALGGNVGGEMMRELAHRRKLPLYIMVASILTVLSGFGLYWRLETGSVGSFGRSPMGMALGLGGLLAVIAWVIGFTVSRPSGMRMGALSAEIARSGGAPSAAQREELARLQKRMGWAQWVGAVLLILTTALMAVARYV